MSSDCRNKKFNVTIHGKNLFDQPVGNDLITHNSIQKTAVGRRNDYTTGFLLDSCYFKYYYKIISIEWSKQQALDAHSKAIHQINFS